MNPPPVPPGEPVAVARRMNDFPGRLSPMLVKELRQGMRTNLFSVAFILLQALMVLSLLAGLADPGSWAASGFFWFFVVVILLVIQPLRGINALSSEYLLNTMDLIQLTKLDAWRITFGKWTALNAQTLLFVTGVLPYLVMRYFLGNVNFVIDLAGLFFLTLGSALASSITIGFSAFRQFLLRGILVIVFGIGFVILYAALQAVIFRPGIGSANFSTLGLATVALVYGCFFFLSFGASRIAPPSENHSTRKRLVALILTFLSLSFLWFGIDEAVLAVVSLILGFACIDALTEPLPVYAKVLEPFRKNSLTRLASLVFTPGWLGGLGFFFLCFCIAAALARFAFEPIFGKLAWDTPIIFVTGMISVANLILFPLIFIHLFFPRHASGSFTFGIYIFIQACLLLLTIMTGALASALSRYDELIYCLVPIPSVLLVALENGGSGSQAKLIYLAAALLSFLLGFAMPMLRQQSAIADYLRHLKKS